MALPIHVSTPGIEIPPGNCYIVGKNGMFLRKDTGIICATVRVHEIPGLTEIQRSVRFRMDQIPIEIFDQAFTFFRRVYELYLAEAFLALYANVGCESFFLHCPQQEVGAGGAHYGELPRIKDARLIGDLHSHAGMEAFHSAIDVGDEVDFDGIHITLGNMQLPQTTLSMNAVVNGDRFELKPEDWITEIKDRAWDPVKEPPPVEQLDLVNLFDDLSLAPPEETKKKTQPKYSPYSYVYQPVDAYHFRFLDGLDLESWLGQVTEEPLYQPAVTAKAGSSWAKYDDLYGEKEGELCQYP